MSAQHESLPRYDCGRTPATGHELLFTLAILVANFKLEDWRFCGREKAQEIAKRV
jgi:hypothetical protein